MIKEHTDFFRKMLLVVDLGIIMFSFFLAYVIRNTLETLYPINTYLELLPVLLVIWGSALYFFGIYTSFRMRNIPDILFAIFKASFMGFITFGSFTYIVKLQYISRSFVILLFVLSALLLSIEKIMVMYTFRVLRKKGYNFRSILLIGTGRRAQNFLNLLEEHAEWGLKVIGLVDEDAEKVGEEIKGYKILGSFLDIPNIIHNRIIDEVVFVVPRSWLARIEEIIRFIDLEGIKVSLAVDIFELKYAKAIQTDIDGYPLITFERTPGRLWQLIVKRVFDLICSGIALILLSPVFLFIFLAVKFTSEGPVFFTQLRCGMNGRKFNLYKFRTMVLNAEAQLEELKNQNEMDGPAFKMANDPRVTKIGKFLRKLSLDELPQFWNVFKGEMSLVGPRPPIPSEVRHYDNWQRRRLSMRPGITCLWQVGGRNKIVDFKEWANLDLEYIDNWSLWLDLKILLKTIPVVIMGSGA